MSDEEQAQWPAWKRAVYQVDYSESGYPSVTDRLLAASVKNNRGGTSWSSWESPDESAIEVSKRLRSESPAARSQEEDPDRPDSKKTKIKMSDFTDDQVNKHGNAAKDNVKTITQETPCAFCAHPAIKAMWLVVEPSYGPYDAYGQAWLRPATQLCESLEAQLEADIGCQSYTLTYENNYGEPTKHYFEHDLRGDEWVQRRYYDEGKLHLKSSKQLLRVMIGT